MDFIQCNSTNYRAGRAGAILFIVIHYTGNNGDTAKNNCNYFKNNANLGASAHYFVDENGTCQSVAEGDTAWHCGATTYNHSSCRNYNSIGIEMCSRKDSAGKYYIKDETAANAAQLTRELMEKYGIPVDNVLRHYDVTWKSCPEPWVRDPSLWTAFKKSLEVENLTREETKALFSEMLNEHYDQLQGLLTNDWHSADWTKAKAAGIFDGTMPQAPMTREQAATVLNRLGLIK